MAKIQYEKLSEFIQANSSSIESREKEDVLRHRFTQFLPQIFIDNPLWIDVHTANIEYTSILRKSGQKRNGFADSAIGKTIFEYEKNLNNQRIFLHGKDQIQDYCTHLVNQYETSEEIIGILSDTIKWIAFKVKIRDEVTFPIESSDVELIQIEEVDLKNNTATSHKIFIQFVEKYFARNESIQLNSNEINKFFGIKSVFYKNNIIRIKNTIKRAFDENPQYSEVIKSIWSDIISFKDEKTYYFDINNYSDEFYLMTLAKLISSNVISGKPLIGENDEITNILTGRFFETQNISNMVEYDFFGWINEKYLHEIIDIFRDMQWKLAIFDFRKINAEDFFGNIVTDLALRDNRILLGQEYTPNWLAKSIVIERFDDEINFESRLLDMCCGSGVFLIEILKKKYTLLKEINGKDIQLIMQSVVGVDIHPLAVMLAKANWIMLNKPYFEYLSPQKSIHIPIYNADSLFLDVPTLETFSSEKDPSKMTINLGGHRVVMPTLLFEHDSKYYDEIISKLYKLAVLTVLQNNSEPELSRESELELNKSVLDVATIFFENDRFSDEYQAELRDFCFDLTIAFYKLQKENRNGVWSFIMRNSYRPLMLKRKFDYIISNPPWLALSKLGNNPYAPLLKEKARELEIAPQGSSFLHLDLAFVFFVHSISFYLQDNGKFAFILPDSFLNGEHTRAMRLPKFNDKYLAKYNEIWKIESNIFSSKAIALFGDLQKGENAKIKGKVVGENGRKSIDFELVKLKGKVSYSQVNDEIELDYSKLDKFPTSKFNQGADIMPRTYFFYEFSPLKNGGWKVNRIHQGSKNYYLIKDAKKACNFAVNADNVSDEYVFECILSNHITPFHLFKTSKAFLPIKKVKSWTSLSLSDLANFNQSTTQLVDSLIIDSGNDYFSLYNDLNTRGKLEKQQFNQGDWLVLYGAGGANVCATAIEIISSDKPPIIDQTLYWKLCSTKEEAYYYVGMLNSTRVNKVSKVFQPEGNQGKRHVHTTPLKFIPKYTGNKIQVTIANYAENIVINFPKSAIDASDPSKSSLASRRKKVSSILSKNKVFITLNESVDEYIEELFK